MIGAELVLHVKLDESSQTVEYFVEHRAGTAGWDLLNEGLSPAFALPSMVAGSLQEWLEERMAAWSSSITRSSSGAR